MPQCAQSAVPSADRFTFAGDTALLAESDPAAPAGLTVTVRSSDALNAPSSPVSLSTYVPAALKSAVVLSAFALPNVTVPGPLTFVQAVETAAGGFGSPSSVTAPLKLADPGSMIALSLPAFTKGAWFTGGATPPVRVTA